MQSQAQCLIQIAHSPQLCHNGAQVHGACTGCILCAYMMGVMMRHNKIVPLVLILMITSIFTACMGSEINTTSPPTKTPLPSPEVQPSATTPPPSPTTLPSTSTPTSTQTPTPKQPFGPLPEGALARFGKGISTSLALTPDGRLLAVGTTQGVYVYQVDTLEEVWRGETNIAAIGTLKVVADGTQLVAGHYHGVVVAWDVKTGEQLYTLATDAVLIPDISPDGKYLLALTESDEWELWDIAAGQPIRVLADGAALHDPVIFSPDGSRIAGSIDGQLVVWDTTSWQVIDYPGVQGDVFDLAWAWDNSRLAVIAYSDNDNLAYVLTETDSVSLESDYGSNKRKLLGWAQDNSIVVTYQMPVDSTSYHRVIWWNPGTGEPEHTLLLEDFPCHHSSIAYSPDIIAAASQMDGMLMVYDWTSGEVLHQSFEHATGASDLAFSPDGTLLASAPWYGGGVTVWDVETGARVRRIAEADESVAWSPDGSTLATGSYGDTYGYGAVILWEPLDGTVIQVFTPQSDRPASWITHVTWSPDGAQVAANMFCGSETFIWDVETGQQLFQIDGANMHFSPDGAFIATGHRETDPGPRIIIRDRSNNDPLLTIFGTLDMDMDWSPDGRLLASEDGVWEVATGQELYPLSGHTGPVDSVAFSPDGSYLATAGREDHLIIIWDAHTGERLWTFTTGHVWPLTSLAWSPDGSVLASGSDDGTIILWDITVIER
jgi:WD40 repeat protein